MNDYIIVACIVLLAIGVIRFQLRVLRLERKSAEDFIRLVGIMQKMSDSLNVLQGQVCQSDNP